MENEILQQIELNKKCTESSRSLNALKAVKKYDINHKRLCVLYVLYKSGDAICINELSDQTGILPPALSRFLPTLEGQRLIKRVISRIDYRTHFVRLTKYGKKCVELALTGQNA